MAAFLIPDNFIQRGDMKLEELVAYSIPMTAWRVWNAPQTNLPGTAATDDLAVIDGTSGYATNSITIQTSDAKATSVTQYARVQLVLPSEYVATESVVIRAHAAMATTVSDTTAALDFQAYESDKEEGVGSDLVATAAQSINSLTFADKDFVVTTTGLVAGDPLDVRMEIAIVDGATGTAVKGLIGAVALLLDVRG